MGKLDQNTAPPLPDLSLDGSDQECPECLHGRMAMKETWLDRIFLKLGARPGPATCDDRVEYEADPCGCQNQFHGS